MGIITGRSEVHRGPMAQAQSTITPCILARRPNPAVVNGYRKDEQCLEVHVGSSEGALEPCQARRLVRGSGDMAFALMDHDDIPGMMASKRRYASIVTLGSSALVFLAPTIAAADGPYRDEETVCIAVLLLDATPANLEWSYWLTGGGGLNVGAPSNRFGVIGGGVEATTQLTEIGTGRRYGGAFELRGGPWWGITSDLQGARAEGGYVFSVGQVAHAQWGTYAVRIGGGLGDDSLGLSPHFVATITGGIRSVPGRYTERGACDVPPKPKESALAENVRLFATARTTFADAAPWQLTFGIELSPTFFLPPYSLRKWIGSRPD